MGLFEFNRMPFGLNGAPGTMQRLMDKLLEGMNCAMAYIDDILVYSSSVESHKKDLRTVLKRVKLGGWDYLTRFEVPNWCQGGIISRPCVFSKRNVTRFGKKIKIIQQWPQPTTISDVRRFHGLAS